MMYYVIYKVLSLVIQSFFTTVAPYMECRKLHDVTLVFGDRVKFDVPIFGEPAPEVVWTFEAAAGSASEAEGPQNLESTPDRNVIVTSDESHAKLVINRSV